MTDPHLSDPDIQEYVLEKANCEMHIIEHIRNCEHCRTRAETYRILFAGIKDQPVPEFDFNLAGMVLAELKPYDAKFSWTIFFVYFFTLTGIASISIVIYLLRANLATLFSGISIMFLYILITTSFAVLIFQCFEIYKKYKRQMDVLNFY